MGAVYFCVHTRQDGLFYEYNSTMIGVAYCFAESAQNQLSLFSQLDQLSQPSASAIADVNVPRSNRASNWSQQGSSAHQAPRTHTA
mmetsp:Transcript_20494/g.40285  ORF Transcript_20494/g.40285 Transcript_20494/m.40285 type:complete len:86 (-) Transcript_20494:116-373(-)